MEPYSHRGFTFHKLTNASLEEVAAAVRLRREATPGEAFIQKLHNHPEAERVKAFYSRGPVMSLYHEFPGTLRILTLPGLKWIFERRLLKWRSKNLLETQITAVESDPAIYRAALAWMPGTELSVRDSNTVISNVAWYEHTTFEELIERGPLSIDGAWLDFNGPLSMRKLEAIWALWQQVADSIVVTFLTARAPRDITAQYIRRGGWGGIFQSLLGLPKEKVEVSYYLQHNWMCQIAILKGKRRLYVPANGISSQPE